MVLEMTNGRLVGIEVKAAGTVEGKDFKGLRSLREETGSRFHRGIVLYGGEQTVSFESDLMAVPVSALWEWHSRAAQALA